MKKAFSLLELLVVILILGLLAAFVVPNLIGAGEKAKRDLVCSQMSSIEQALKMFKLDNGMYPETEEGLEMVEMSNVDLEKEMATMMVDRRSIEANLKILKTAGEMLGTIIDIKS